MIQHPPLPNWFFFPTEETKPTSPQQRLRAVEDEVRRDLGLRDRLYQLVAYKYLHGCGYRISSIDGEIRREAGK